LTTDTPPLGLRYAPLGAPHISQQRAPDGDAVPCCEFVPNPHYDPAALSPPGDDTPGRWGADEAEEVVLHTIHAGDVIPAFIREHLSPEEHAHLEAMHQHEKDWGSDLVCAAIARELNLRGHYRVNIARCVMDFGRFPGIDPPGSSLLDRLAISDWLAQRIGHQRVRILLDYYDQISRAYEEMLWWSDAPLLEPEDEELPLVPTRRGARPRQLSIAVHTYDRYNKEHTLRPPISLIYRSRTYEQRRTMHPGPFDRLFPDELAEFTADRCLIAGIAHTFEKMNVGVADNHPYSMPDGSLEIRAQVWFFFRYLRQRFAPIEQQLVSDPDCPLEQAHFELVWKMLSDTNLRETIAATLQSYLHDFRRADNIRLLLTGAAGTQPLDQRFLDRCVQAYGHIARLVDQRAEKYPDQLRVVQEYRLHGFSGFRPSSLGLEVRKDLVWEFLDPAQMVRHPDGSWLTPNATTSWRRPKIGDGAREYYIDLTAEYLSAAIRSYLVSDRREKRKTLKRARR